MICEDGGCMAKLSGHQLMKIIGSAIQTSGLSDSNEVAKIRDGVFDDCAIILENDHNKLYSIDFGPLVGDDLETAGKIAVLNALSDIWVTGGKPEGALIILMASSEMNDDEIEKLLSSIFKTCKDFNVNVYGGHTIIRSETIIGLSVIGSSAVVNTKRKQNVELADKIWISKPLGTGITLRGFYHDLVTKQQYSEAIQLMLTPNQLSNELVQAAGVHAITDVTGYGLLGHLSEMIGNDLGAVLFRNRIPTLPFLKYISPGFAHSTYIDNNYQYALLHHRISIDSNNITDLSLLDPQTNGPVMLIASPDFNIMEICNKFTCIGEITSNNKIVVEDTNE